MTISLEDLQVIIDSLNHRIKALDSRIHRAELKELRDPDYRRERQIRRYATAVDELHDVLDRLEGDSE